MTSQEFSVWCAGCTHLLDGATGSMLRASGMPVGVCTERWVLDHPQVLTELQQSYLRAGSDIVYAPTFGANRELLRNYNMQEEVRTFNLQLAQLSRAAHLLRAI